MNIVKITHTGTVIDWVNGPDKKGAQNTYLKASRCGGVVSNTENYEMRGKRCVLKDDSGRNLAEKKEAFNLVSSRIISAENEADLIPIEYGGQIYKITDTVDKSLKRCDDLNDTDSLPFNNGKWDNYNGTVSTDFTVSDLKALRKKAFDRNANNYENMKIHVSAISAMIADPAKTRADIIGYDFSTGWNE